MPAHCCKIAMGLPDGAGIPEIESQKKFRKGNRVEQPAPEKGCSPHTGR